MQVVPVLDLMGGQVVHARRGERAAYSPLQSPLVSSSAPIDVLAGLLELAPFRTVYVADLDAIQGRGDHCEELARLQATFPALELWVDAGFSDADTLGRLAHARRVPVIGSESLASLEALAAMRAIAPHAILSLDTRGPARLGPASLFDAPEHWPERVIVMALDRVGASAGPALERLRHTLAQAPHARVIAAGGVRDAHDLASLEAMGVYAVLVASAIHDGRLDRATLGAALSR